MASTTDPTTRAAGRPRASRYLSFWLCVAATVWIVWGPGPNALPHAADFEIADVATPHVPARVHIPTLVATASEEALLDERVEALAREVGHLRRRVSLARDVSFDSDGLRADIESVVARIDGRADVSVHVRDLENGRVLFDYAGDAQLNAASNQKLVTSAAALEFLGSEYVFATRVRRVGNVLYVLGEGDPTLTANRLYALAQDVAQNVPVAEIERLVVDDHVFSDRRFGPGYAREGPGYAYQAPSGALSIDFNTVEIVAYAGRRRPRIFVRPESPYVEVRNEAVATRGRTRLIVTSSRRGGKTLVTVRGRMRRGAPPWSVRRRVYDPALHAGTTLATMLAEISETEPLPVSVGRSPADAEIELVYESPALLEVVDRILAYSSNFGAEQLLRTLGWRMTGQPGDWKNGTEVLRGYWEALGHDPSGLDFENGSGLSVTGRVSSRALVDLVETAYRLGRDNANLVDALAVAGEAGTLRKRLRRSGARVRAKTGTLPGVSALTGVIVRTDETPQVAFSIIINARDSNTLRARRRRKSEDAIVLAVLSACDDFEARRDEHWRAAVSVSEQPTAPSRSLDVQSALGAGEYRPPAQHGHASTSVGQ